MRDRILEAAFNQILKYGIRRFTIDDITTELGISRKTIYKYFESKSRLIETVLDNYMSVQLNRPQEVMTSTQDFQKRFAALMLPSGHQPIPTRVLAELQQYFPDLWKSCEEAVRIIRDQIAQIYSDGIQNGEIRSDVHPAVINLVVKNAIDGVLDYRFLAENDIGLNQALEGVKSMVLHGILVPEQAGRGEE